MEIIKFYLSEKQVEVFTSISFSDSNSCIKENPFLDADIMKTRIDDSNSLCKFLRKNKVFVLDRGFRDAVEDLEEDKTKKEIIIRRM